MSRAKRKWRVGDLLADERCSPALLDFLRSTYVGRAAPPVEESWDSEDEEKWWRRARRRRRGRWNVRSSDPRAPGVLLLFFFYLLCRGACFVWLLCWLVFCFLLFCVFVFRFCVFVMSWSSKRGSLISLPSSAFDASTLRNVIFHQRCFERKIFVKFRAYAEDWDCSEFTKRRVKSVLTSTIPS